MAGQPQGSRGEASAQETTAAGPVMTCLISILVREVACSLQPRTYHPEPGSGQEKSPADSAGLCFFQLGFLSALSRRRIRVRRLSFRFQLLLLLELIERE